MLISRIIYRFERWLIILTFVFIFCLSFLQVILRYFFNAGFAWVPEIVVFAFIIITLAAASTGVKSGVHIGVDVIVKLLPTRFQTICYFLTNIAGLLLYFFMCYLTYEFVLSFKEMGQVSTITELPVWIMIAYMPVSFFLMGIHYCEALWETYTKYKKGESMEVKLKEHI
ncbi:MAG: TRAP transporter small permease [Deltaproteobacteria bacterium]|jgi:C4-dicarboxylate transporter DctQ subunit|nr:TRAP transporter small permease [Deltaproteobacteria bacterium]MBT4269184.1 TRAP transporter small permease [Deltaproteobacteria bacterium]MBT4644564.1 TRAP transporter small permease [Deltaproteobacteria bacterium]MBT6501856.1 TRAP transporter small permease [Deltaproteobacteria bacterium]MBT6612510.1 TRAP transporter small permease [Deltaproteobacteria bacterium]